MIKLSVFDTQCIVVNRMSIPYLIPKGTVDNNLGPDCLAGPKALDPNYCRQPTL